MTIDSNDRLWMFGGRSTSVYFGDLWTFDTRTKQWTWIGGAANTGSYGSSPGPLGVPTAPGGPGTFSGAELLFSAPTTLFLLGGYGIPAGFNTFSNLFMMFAFDTAAQLWTW
jgi:hypothetical protein